MKPLRWLWLGAAAVICLLAMGVPYAFTPYGHLSVYSLYPGLYLTGLCCGLLVVLRVGLVRSVLVLGTLAPLIVWLRVSVDTASDPTSHNLWPFEIVLAVGVSMFWVLAGGVLGMLVAHLRRKAGRGSGA